MIHLGPDLILQSLEDDLVWNTDDALGPLDMKRFQYSTEDFWVLDADRVELTLNRMDQVVPVDLAV